MTRPMDCFAQERCLLEQGVLRIAGVDEAGRGPLAGPVVAAAVVFPASLIREGLPPPLTGLTDSKRLSAAHRERLFLAIEALPTLATGVGCIDPPEIDRLNILRATHQAMQQAVRRLSPRPDHLLVDGLPAAIPGLPQTALVHGDALSFSIAAASILAKVIRDRLMDEYDVAFPGYGFRQHKGYPTPAHFEALARLGPCAIHRRSFAPVRHLQPELFPGFLHGTA